MKKIFISSVSFLTLCLPMLVLADEVKTGYIKSLITGGIELTRNALVFLISLAVVWFIWNVIQYTISDDEEKKGKAKEQMIWGIIGIAVIVSVWGLVSLLRNMFLSGTTNTAPTDLNSMIPPAI